MYLASQRKEFILKTLAEHGAARTIALAKQMKVTDETVRNDLINLENAASSSASTAAHWRLLTNPSMKTLSLKMMCLSGLQKNRSEYSRFRGYVH